MTYEMTNLVDRVEKYRNTMTGNLETHVLTKGGDKYRIVPFKDSKGRIKTRSVFRHRYKKTLPAIDEHTGELDIYEINGTELIETKDTVESLIDNIRLGIIR